VFHKYTNVLSVAEMTDSVAWWLQERYRHAEDEPLHDPFDEGGSR